MKIYQNSISLEIEIKKQNVSKKGNFKNISPKCLLETLDVSGPILLNMWNQGIFKGCEYPDKLKFADLSPVYKKANLLFMIQTSLESLENLEI